MGLNWMMNAACGGKDSIDHTFIYFSFTNSFAQKVTVKFNTINNSQISPTTEGLLFGIITNASGKKQRDKEI